MSYANARPFNSFSKLSIGDWNPAAKDVAALGVQVTRLTAGLDPDNIGEEVGGSFTARFRLTTFVQNWGINMAQQIALDSKLTVPQFRVRHYFQNMETGAFLPPVNAANYTNGVPAPAGNAPTGFETWYKAETAAIALQRGVYRVLTVLSGGGAMQDDVAAFHDGTYIDVIPHTFGPPGPL